MSTKSELQAVSLDQAQSPSRHLESGSIFDEHYKIVCHLGAGGWANVYKAVHVHMDKPVALKLLRPSMCDDNRKVRRFKQEAKTTAEVKNHHLINTRSFGICQGTPYLVMDYVEGDSLDAILSARGKLPRAEAISIGQQLCSALGSLHEHGIIHRDVKPGNIIIAADGVCKLVDFGVAKLEEWGDLSRKSNENLTATGTFIGSPGYMSPEQAASGKVDGRSDIYGLGCLLFELLTGHMPYEADTHYAMLSQHMYAPVPALPVNDPTWEQDGLDQVVQKCLAKSPEDRFQNAQQLSDALSACAAKSSRTVRRPSFLREARFWFCGQQARGLANLCVLSVAGLTLLSALFWQPALPDVSQDSQFTAHDLLRKADIALDEKNYRDGERDLKSALVQIKRLPPRLQYDRIDAELRLGQTLLVLSDPEQALPYLISAAQASSKTKNTENARSREIFAGLGECYGKLGRPGLSAYWYERALSSDPRCGCEIWVQAGAAMYRAGRYQEIGGEKFPWQDDNSPRVINPSFSQQAWGAIPVLRRASQLAEQEGKVEELIPALDMLAASLTRMRRYSEAEAAVKKMFVLGTVGRTSQHTAQRRLSNLRLSQGRLAEAREILEALLAERDVREDRSLIAGIYADLGIILYEQKNYRQAAVCFDNSYRELQNILRDNSVRGRAEGMLDSMLWVKQGRDLSLIKQ